MSDSNGSHPEGNRTRPRWWIPVALGAVAIGGAALVLFGGADTPTDSDGDPDDGRRGETLPITDTSAEAVSELAGLELPAGTADFLTARLDDDSQLDVTFTIDPSEEPAFIDGSSLGEPVVDERVIFHSSPLWELNAEGARIRGVADARPDGTSEVRRAVELTEEDGRTRVRLVITPA